MRITHLFIFLIVFFIALPSYCNTNFSPKNVKGKKAITSQTTATVKEAETQSDKKTYGQDEGIVSTSNTQPSKALPDEKTGSIQVPRMGGTVYGTAQEKTVRVKLGGNTNFSPKNVKGKKVITSQTTATVKEAQKTAAEKPEAKKDQEAQSDKETYGQDEGIVSTPTYYSEPSKALLDEKTRYIQAPGEGGAGHGMAQEKMVRIKLEGNINYDDNIYLTKDDTRYDIVSTISPGVYGYIGNDQYTAMGFYEADVLIYGRYTKEDRINQTVGGRVDLFKQGRINVSLQDALRPTTDPATNEVAPFVKRVGNDFSANVRYDMSPKTSLAVNYSQYLQYYVTDDYKQYSYLQHTISPVFYYHLSSKLSLTGEYNLGMTNYMGGANYNSLFNQARVGIEGTLTPKSRVYLRAGYQHRQYYNSDTKNTDGVVLQLGYDYSISPKTALSLVASSDIAESVWQYNAYYDSYNFYASLTHHLFYNLDVMINGVYLLSSYPREVNSVDGMRKRMDNLYGAGARISYHLRTWLSAYAGYDFKCRNSNIRDLEYTDDIVSGGLKLSF
ncbi:MAG: outer membrane beta-barrel protein [Candidatus Omnitrophica bacterium]|nr:outer membrane beta-barrel protein [Candidatus Omnitrophota bacterium]